MSLKGGASKRSKSPGSRKQPSSGRYGPRPGYYDRNNASPYGDQYLPPEEEENDLISMYTETQQGKALVAVSAGKSCHKIVAEIT
jgi:hypothetical protein